MEKANKQELLRQFKLWKLNNNHRELIEAQGVELTTDELIIELFVADFTDESSYIDYDYYVRYTPVARVLAVGKHANDSFGWWDRLRNKHYRPGDLVLVEDLIVAQIESKNYLDYLKAREHPQFNDQGPPPRWQKKIYQWVGEGMLYVPDKTELCVNTRFINFNQEFITRFDGPYVFRLPVTYVGVKIKKPFVV